MWIRHICLAAAGLACLAGCDDAGTGPGESVQYFPLSIGNHWTYAPENPVFGDPFDWTVIQRELDTVTLDRPPGGSHPGPVVLLDHGDDVDIHSHGLRPHGHDHAKISANTTFWTLFILFVLSK